MPSRLPRQKYRELDLALRGSNPRHWDLNPDQTLFLDKLDILGIKEPYAGEYLAWLLRQVWPESSLNARFTLGGITIAQYIAAFAKLSIPIEHNLSYDYSPYTQFGDRWVQSKDLWIEQSWLKKLAGKTYDQQNKLQKNISAEQASAEQVLEYLLDMVLRIKREVGLHEPPFIDLVTQVDPIVYPAGGYEPLLIRCTNGISDATSSFGHELHITVWPHKLQITSSVHPAYFETTRTGVSILLLKSILRVDDL